MWPFTSFRQKPTENATPKMEPRVGLNFQAATVIENSSALANFIRNGGETSSGATVTVDTAMRASAVNACVRLIATTGGMLPCPVYREAIEGQKEKAKGNDAHRILTRKPNRWQTPFDFKTLMFTNVLLQGNAYALKVYSRDRLLEVVPLHPSRVTPKQFRDGSVEYLYSRPDGQTAAIKQSDMFHVKFMTLDGLNGITPIRYLAESIGLALQTEKASAKLFKNGALVGGALTVPTRLSEEARDHLRESLEQRYAGAENSHRWMLLEEGLGVAQVGMTASDAQFIESRRFQIEDIARAFGIPPYMIGETDKTTANGAGMESQSRNTVNHVFGPYFRMWEEACNRDLLTDIEAEDHYVKVNVNALLRGDTAARAAYFQAALGNGGTRPWMTPQEIRMLEDMNVIPTFGELINPVNIQDGGIEEDKTDVEE